jgi:hypothetical protein
LSEHKEITILFEGVSSWLFVCVRNSCRQKISNFCGEAVLTHMIPNVSVSCKKVLKWLSKVTINLCENFGNPLTWGIDVMITIFCDFCLICREKYCDEIYGKTSM